MYKKYFYEISNVVFSLNIKVELFEKYHFTSNKSESWNIYIFPYHLKRNVTTFALNSNTNMSYNVDEKKMHFYVDDINDFLNVFYNFPLQIMIISEQKGLLFHSSAIKYDQNVVLLSGDSGAGKSTIAELLCAPFECIADDTIRISSGNIHLTQVSPIKKVYCVEKTALYTNEKNKLLCNVSCFHREKKYFLSAIFNICRCNNKGVTIRQIKKPIDIYSMLFKNISMIKNLNGEIIKKIDFNIIYKIAQNISCYDIYIENNFDILPYNIKYLREFIMSQFEGEKKYE